MIDNAKVKPVHLERAAFVYIRQSSPSQLERNLESTDRQYKLVHRALDLGWTRPHVTVIDEDQGRSGSGLVDRAGFEKMAAEVALGRVGIVLGLEVSRLARNNADWYRLLDLCGLTNTLIGDSDGVYHPALINDRLVLGLKGTMSETELHVLRARLDGGIRNKAARGELHRGLPIGFVRGDRDGEVRFDPDAALTGAIRTVFERFAETGSARRVWLWFRSQGLPFPLRSHPRAEIRWVIPTYVTIHQILTSPVYAGAYVYGRTRFQRYVDEAGRIRKRARRVPRSEWTVFIPNHHQGFIDWDTYERNQARIAANNRPQPHQAGGAVREGAALLQGIASCGRCGRRLHVYYQGKNSTPGYYCSGGAVVDGRGTWCLRVGGALLDEVVAKTFLETITPAGLEAALVAERSLESEHDAALAQWRLEVERARYEAERAERRYRAVEPENRLVARGLETEWEKRLRELTVAEAQLAQRERERPRALTPEERDKICALGADLGRVWSASTTTDRDRKELLRTLLEEVNVAIERAQSRGRLTLRWRGGVIHELDVPLRSRRVPALRTDEDTIDLVRRLAVHYSDAIIAGILNRQGKKTATGDSFTVDRVGNLRRYWEIPRFEPPSILPEGEPVTIDKAAEILGIAPSTLHRWLADGFIAGEQLTPGAPWRIRVTEQLRARFVDEEREGYVPMQDATKLLGVSRQTILQRVKRGELQAIHLRRGKRKGLRIRVIDSQPSLFEKLP